MRALLCRGIARCGLYKVVYVPQGAEPYRFQEDTYID